MPGIVAQTISRKPYEHFLEIVLTFTFGMPTWGSNENSDICILEMFEICRREQCHN